MHPLREMDLRQLARVGIFRPSSAFNFFPSLGPRRRYLQLCELPVLSSTHRIPTMSLALYKPLVDNDEKTRLEAAKQLTTELTELLSGEATEEAKKGVDYALKRLTRGLASGRESARPGFAVVLTEVWESRAEMVGEVAH